MQVAQHLPAHGARGYSLIEVLVAIAVFGVLVRTAVPLLNSKKAQLGAAQRQVIAQLRLARISAVSQDTHYSVTLKKTGNQILVYPMTYNGTAWQANSTPTITVNLPSATGFASASDSTFEFNSRGITVGLSAVKQIDLTDVFNATKSLQVWPSGQINEL